MTTIIILSIIAVLVLVGATQRKKIALVVSGKVNEVVEKGMTSISTAKQMIRNAKEKAIELINQAAKLKALEDTQLNTLNKLTDDLAGAQTKAEKAKADGNKELAMATLLMIKEFKNQITLIEENIEVATKQRLILENKIAKIKGQINTYNIKVEGLKARKETNDVLKTLNTDKVGGMTLNEVVEGCETNVKSEEVILDYKTDLDEETEAYTKEIEDEYENM